MTVLLLLAGFVLLVAGAEVLVRGASNVAGRFGISLGGSASRRSSWG